MEKYSRRLVKVGKNHNDDCKELLRLMGVPVVNAPCEAEAQCAELARKNRVYATATEDMDALTFQTPKLLRKLTFSQVCKIAVVGCVYACSSEMRASCSEKFAVCAG